MNAANLGDTDETLFRTRYMAKWDYCDDADNPGDSLSRRFYNRLMVMLFVYYLADHMR